MSQTLPPKGAPCKGRTRRARNTVAARRYRARHRAAYNARARERQRRQREARRAALSRSAQDVLQRPMWVEDDVSYDVRLVEVPPVFRPVLRGLPAPEPRVNDPIYLPATAPRSAQLGRWLSLQREARIHRALVIARGRRRARQAWAERTVALSPLRWFPERLRALRAELLSEVAA